VDAAPPRLRRRPASTSIGTACSPGVGAGNSASIRILEALGLKFERLVRLSDDGSESRLFVLDYPGIRG